MTATWPDPDPGWRIRAGVGLLAHTPMSDERRAAFEREDEKERKAAEFEAQQRAEAALEHRWELERQGVVPHSVGDVLAASAVAADRQDRRDAAAEERAAIELGKPPRSAALLREAKAQREAREAEAEAAPASQAELGRAVAKLKNSVQNTIGKWLP